jgi:hypothetical protein
MAHDEIQWKQNSHYPNYAISEYGDVKRLTNSTNAIAGKILKPWSHQGYLELHLTANGIQKRFKVHSLVAEAFIGVRPEGLQVNHKDCDKLNNHYSNLEYVTAAENTRHAWRNGRCHVGESSKKAVLKEWQVRGILTLKSKMAVREVAKLFRCGVGTVSEIQTRKIWKHVDGCGCKG